MKIGVVMDQYVPQDGGAHTMQGELLSAICRLAKESKHSFVIFSPENEKVKSLVTGSGLEWCAYSKRELPDRLLSFVWPELTAKLNVKAPLEKRAVENGIGFLWFLSPRIASVDLPYMTIVLDLQHRLQPWFPEVSADGEWELRERHYAQLLPRAAAVIVGTRVGKKEVQDFYSVPEERIHILPHPTPQAALSALADDGDTLKQIGIKPGYIFYPAQFWAHKNHVNLLRAIALLRDDDILLDVVFTGSDFGNQTRVQDEVTRLKLDEQVKFLGFVTQAELNSLYRKALALTYVSFFGPENLPPLEAFALGCPVVAADVSGAQEQLGEAALLVNPQEAKSIANGIKKIIQDDKLRDQLIERGRLRAKSWTADDFVQGALKVIDTFEPVRNTWH